MPRFEMLVLVREVSNNEVKDSIEVYVVSINLARILIGLHNSGMVSDLARSGSGCIAAAVRLGL
jgi:hypothetical protein